MKSNRLGTLICVTLAIIIASSLPALGQFKYTEKPTLDKVPSGTISGQANGKAFEAKFVAFQPSYKGNWEMIIADKPFEPADIIMDCQHIDIDLPEFPAAGKVMSKPMEYGKGIWQIQDTDDPTQTTSWNADNAWVIEITSWDVKPWDPDADMFQQAGTASGRIAVCYKGASGSFKNSWAAGTFTNAPVRYMGEPPAAIKNAPAAKSGDSKPAAAAPAGSTKTIPSVSATAGKYTLIGQPGDWANTIAATMLDGKIYSVEASGSLFVTDPITGKWSSIGNPEFISTLFMFSAAGKLYSIEESGSLILLDHKTGARKQIGKAADWKNTIAIAMGADKLYSVETSGVLYITDPATGIWKQLGKSEFQSTKFLFFAKGSLYSIESSGTLYKINLTDGSWTSVGNAGAFSETLTGTTLNDMIYTADADGSLVQTMPESGNRTVLGKPDFGGTQFLIPVGVGLTSIESTGSMYAINVK